MFDINRRTSGFFISPVIEIRSYLSMVWLHLIYFVFVVKMVVYSVFIISKSGGLIYSYDHTPSSMEIEKTFSYPLDLKLDYINQRVVVTFGQRDGIRGMMHTLQETVILLYLFSWILCSGNKWRSHQRQKNWRPGRTYRHPCSRS